MRENPLGTAKLLAMVGVLLLLLGCGERRFYPLMTFHPTERPDQRLDLGAVALTSTGLVVAINEVDSSVIYEIAPYFGMDGVPRTLDPYGSTHEDLLFYTDPSQACPGEEWDPAFNRCRNRAYRGYVKMTPRPIAWIPNAAGKVVPPTDVEDLSPLPCPAHDAGCEVRVMGVTEFSTIGRITGFREDKVPKSREQLERLFVLERRAGEWQEILMPDIEVLRQRLSDWGRANCEVDFVVEGLAYDNASDRVYVGVNRCQGIAQTVLSYDLARARAGATADITVIAQDILDGRGESIAGPSEGLSSLDFAHGLLWATSSWDDYGYRGERKYGGRLLVVDDGALRLVPLPRALSDRSDGLAVLPNPDIPAETLESGGPEALFPYLTALILFDNDYGQKKRPNGTIVASSTPAPPRGEQVALMDLSRSPLGSIPIGLNSFDFDWYLRDHRLGYIGMLGGVQERGPGAWTSALGGLWQVRLGTVGKGMRWIGGKGIGHNRQATGLTSYAEAEELRFTGYRATLTVAPGERSGDQVSMAQVFRERAKEYELQATLPVAASPGAGLVLQGFTIDASPRAAGGICVTAVDLSVDWADPEARDRVKLRSMLLGGICNDFNSREPEEFHGLTTDPHSGVRVTLYFAVVEGAEARRGSLLVAERDRPGERRGDTNVVFHGAGMPPLAPYAKANSPEKIGNHDSKGNLACMVVDAAGGTAEVLPFPAGRHGPSPDMVEWMVRPTGELPSGQGEHRAGSLSGFAFALDLRGFDPGLFPTAYNDVTELTARSQNVYLFRYLMRSWITDSSGLFLEGGIAHGLHITGLGQDNAQPTALLVRSDFTWWEGLSEQPVAHESIIPEKPRLDPNYQPEDGYLRWSHTDPMEGGPTCFPR